MQLLYGKLFRVQAPNLLSLNELINGLIKSRQGDQSARLEPRDLVA